MIHFNFYSLFNFDVAADSILDCLIKIFWPLAVYVDVTFKIKSF